MAFVEPLSASKTLIAFSTDFSVMISLGSIGFSTIRAAAEPDASAALRRSACTAGIAAVPGMVIPRVSATQAIVEAVPITAQLPAVVASRPSISSIWSFETSPDLYLAQNLRQSVQAPSLSSP